MVKNMRKLAHSTSHSETMGIEIGRPAVAIIAFAFLEKFPLVPGILLLGFAGIRLVWYH